MSASATVEKPLVPPIRAFELLPSGAFLVTRWAGTNAMGVWRFPDLSRVATLVLRTKNPDASWLSVSRDGKRLVAMESMASSYEARGFELWDTATWKRVDTDEIHLSSNIGGVLTPDAKHAVLYDVYSQAEVFDLVTGKKRMRHAFPNSGAPNRAVDVAVSSDGAFAVVVDPAGPVEVWDLGKATRKSCAPLTRGGGVAAFIPNRNRFLLADGDGSVREMDRTCRVHRTLSGPDGAKDVYSDSATVSLTFSDDGRSVLVVRSGCLSRRIPLQGGRRPTRLVADHPTTAFDMTCVAHPSPKGSRLAVVRRPANGDPFRIAIVDGVSGQEHVLPTMIDSEWFPRLTWFDEHILTIERESMDDETVRQQIDVRSGKSTAEPLVPTSAFPTLSLAIERGVLVATRLRDGRRVELRLTATETPSPQTRAALEALVP